MLGRRLLVVAFSASSSPPPTLVFRSPSRRSKQGEISVFLLVLRFGLDAVLDLLLVSSDFGLPRGKMLGEMMKVAGSVTACTQSMICGARSVIIVLIPELGVTVPL